MKLSDVKGDRTLDVIADLIEPISNVAQDKDVSEMFKRQAVPEGMEAREFFAARMRKGMPALLKGHKDDVIAILATIEGVSPDEYTKSLNLAKIIKDFMELVTDEVFLGFLSSSTSEKADTAATAPSASSKVH